LGREEKYNLVSLVLYSQRPESPEGNYSCSTHNVLNKAEITPGFQEVGNY